MPDVCVSQHAGGLNLDLSIVFFSHSVSHSECLFNDTLIEFELNSGFNE